MKRNAILGVIFGVSTAAMLPSAVLAAEVEDRLAQLEKELADLKAQESSFKSSSGTTVQYGGFIKVDAMWTDYADGADPGGTSDLILVPGAIPVGGESEGTNFDSHVKTSRLFFKTSTNTDAGVVKSHLEFDMLSGDGNELVSNSSHPRLRHAYLSWDYSDSSNLLVGQTWSTFFNVGALPESVEFIGPTSGTVFNRQNMVRWTKKTESGSVMFALENPATTLAGVGTADDNSIPDIVVRVNGVAGNLGWTAAALGREITYSDATIDESEYGLAFNLSGKLSLSNGDDIRASFSHGNLGRYVGLGAFQDGILDADGIELSELTSGHIAYRHKWNDKLRSTIQYAHATADLATGLAGVTETISNLNVNLMYSPTSRLTLGGAYITGEREIDGGASGDLSRLQFVAKLGF